MSRYRKYIVCCLIIFSIFLFTRYLFKPIFIILYSRYTDVNLFKIAEIDPSVQKDKALKGIIDSYKMIEDIGPKGIIKGPFGSSYDPSPFHYWKGVAYFLSGNDYGAINSFKESFEIQHRALPEIFIVNGIMYDQISPEVRIFKGIIYAKQGNFPQAITEFDLGIKGRPLPECYNVRAHTYVLQQNWDMAMRDYNKAIELNPKYYQAYFERGYVYYRQGDLAQALNDFNASVEPSSNARKTPYVLRPVYFEQMKHSRKLSSASRISAINPEAAGVDYDKAIAAFNQGDFRMAVFGFSRAIEKDPYQSKAFVGRAKAFYAQKEYDKAWEDVYTAQVLGVTVDPEFIHSLKAK